MVMGSVFTDAPQDYNPDTEQTDEERRQLLNGPVYGPPAPTPVATQNMPDYSQSIAPAVETGPSVPFDPSLVTSLVDQNGAPVTYGPPVPPPMTPAGLEDVQAPPGSLRAQAIGQPDVGSQGYVPTPPSTFSPLDVLSAAGNFLTSPAGYSLGGPGAFSGGGGGYQPVSLPETYNAFNPSIPVVTPFIENTVKPAVEQGINASPISAPGNYLLDQLGLPSQGELTASQVPSHALDIALTAGPMLAEAAPAIREGLGNYATSGLRGPLGAPEAVAGRDAAENVLRANRAEMGIRGGAMSPEDEAAFLKSDPFEGLNVKPPITPDLGQGPQMIGGEGVNPQGRLFAPQDEPYRIPTSLPQTPLEQEAQRAYDAAYKATMGQHEDKLLNAEAARQEVLNGGPPPSAPGYPSDYGAVPILDESGKEVIPSRLGAPLAYDPALAPNANERAAAEAMRERGIEPRGGGEAPSPVSASGAPPETGISPPPLSREELINQADLTPAQRDFLNSPSGRAAAEQRAGAIDAGRAVGETDTVTPNGGRWADQYGGGGGRTATGAATSGAAEGGGKAAGIGRQIMDILYAPFGGDFSSMLRQDSMRMLNPLRAGESKEVLKDSIKAISSHDEAIRLTEELKQRAQALVPEPHFSDWQGGSFQNRESMYSSLLNKIPGYEALNRGFATEINSRRVNAIEGFARDHPRATPAQLQTEWNRLERTTGRGSLGTGDVEKALSKAGPLFTSMRFAVSIPQRSASLLPWTRLADGSVEMFGPTWREAVKDHAGFIGTVLTAMAAAQQAGLKVGWDYTNQTSGSGGKVPFGTIQLPNGTFVDLTGGARQYVNAVVQLATGEKNGKDYPWLLEKAENGQYKGTIAEFLRNKLGPLPEVAAAGAKEAGVKHPALEFLRPDYWDKGVTGSGSFIDRVGQFVVPLWMQDVAGAFRASADGQKISGAAGAGVASFLGAGVQTYDSRDTLSGLRQSALPDGVKYEDLLPHEKQALNAALEQKYPDQYKAAADNRDPAIKANQDARAQVKAQENAQIDSIMKGLQEGKYDPIQARLAVREAESKAAQQARDLEKSPAYQKAISGIPSSNSVAQRALDAYYAIPNAAKGADGKIDWNKVDQMRNDLYDSLNKAGQSGVAGRIQKEVSTPNKDDHPLLQLYKEQGPMIDKYMSMTPADRFQARQANPMDDALLNYLGYQRGVASQQAADILKGLAPGQNPRIEGQGSGQVATNPAQGTIAAPPPAPAPSRPAAAPASTGATLPPPVSNDSQQRQNFINAMSGPAHAFAQFGLPPAVWMAMGASESNWGRAPSIFGIKGSGTAGSANLATWENYGPGKEHTNINDNFAAYNNLDDAFKHFMDLTSHGRYAGAYEKLQQGDWQGFLQGINRAGYATAPNWADSIISLAGYIEKNYPQQVNALRAAA